MDLCFFLLAMITLSRLIIWLDNNVKSNFAILIKKYYNNNYFLLLYNKTNSLLYWYVVVLILLFFLFFINENFSKSLINTFFPCDFFFNSVSESRFALTPQSNFVNEVHLKKFSVAEFLDTNDPVIISKIYEQIFKLPPTEDIKQNCNLMQEIIIKRVREVSQASFLNFWNQVFIERSIIVENLAVTDTQADFLIMFLHKLFEKGFVNIQVFFPENPDAEIIYTFYSSVSDCRKTLFALELEIFKSDFLTNQFFYQPHFNWIFVDKKTDGGVLPLINIIYYELDYLEKVADNKIQINLFQFFSVTGQLNNYYYFYWVEFFKFLNFFLIRIFWYLLTCYFVLGLTFKYCFRKESIFARWYLESFLLIQFFFNFFYFFYLIVFIFLF